MENISLKEIFADTNMNKISAMVLKLVGHDQYEEFFFGRGWGGEDDRL